ncbi:hypothetical protein MSAN_01095300 [Mycena sanguinolenta]|uniref:DUF6534 domain-containing protein n=1 Tax=Mycena sanguinolenta TaxID=230812 RepID=A0A8H6YNG4_9AGAR|nr:hypothetical protein MSAN_01095300 [Mycena sanguinolenta]
MADVASTLGALLVGGAVALVIRCLMVLAVWLLDLLHSGFIVASLYDYFIRFFGNHDQIGEIPWSIALSVVVTAITTMIVHWYFAHKIYKSSGKNWWITAPIVILAFLRLFAASGVFIFLLVARAYLILAIIPSVSTTEMIRLHRYAVFTEAYPGWVFTTGLTLSASVDIIITAWLCYFLQKMRRRTASSPMAHVVNTLTLYTLENGLVTCLTTTASLICWLTMKQNLIFLGLHFVIGKCRLFNYLSLLPMFTAAVTVYANSLLISLNTRKELREMRWNKSSEWDRTVPVLTSDDFTVPYTRTYQYGALTSLSMSSPTSAYRPAFKVNPRVFPSQLEITVEQRVERSSDDLSEIIRQENCGQRFHRPRSPRHTFDHMRSLP